LSGGILQNASVDRRRGIDRLPRLAIVATPEGENQESHTRE
jgi:hypothetical protein